jgi:hypothetical protein
MRRRPWSIHTSPKKILSVYRTCYSALFHPSPYISIKGSWRWLLPVWSNCGHFTWKERKRQSQPQRCGKHNTGEIERCSYEGAQKIPEEPYERWENWLEVYPSNKRDTLFQTANHHQGTEIERLRRTARRRLAAARSQPRHPPPPSSISTIHAPAPLLPPIAMRFVVEVHGKDFENQGRGSPGACTKQK